MEKLAFSHGVTRCPWGSPAPWNTRQHGLQLCHSFWVCSLWSLKTLCRILVISTEPVFSRPLLPWVPASLCWRFGGGWMGNREGTKTSFPAHHAKALKGMSGPAPHLLLLLLPSFSPSSFISPWPTPSPFRSKPYKFLTLSPEECLPWCWLTAKGSHPSEQVSSRHFFQTKADPPLRGVQMPAVNIITPG